MKLTVEISMYPLQDDYIPAIRAVIEKLNSFAKVEVNTSATATTLVGDFDAVMQAIKETLVWSHEQHGRAVFVSKFIPGYAP